MRILATSDIHIGMTFSTYPEVGEQLAEARFEVLENIVEKANESNVDLITIAGDLFDRPRVAETAVVRAVSILSGFEGSLIAVLPGNHDYTAGRDMAPWHQFTAAAADARLRTIVLDEPRAYDLRSHDLPCVLLAGPCTSRHREEHAIAWTATDSTVYEDAFVLGLAHGSIEGISPDLHGQYYPMRIADFERNRADLWIVGHTHLQLERPTRPGQLLLVPGLLNPTDLTVLIAAGFLCWT